MMKKKPNPSEYTNHSGGCKGADMAWETIGNVYGIKTIAYSFPGHQHDGAYPYVMTNVELNEGWEACKIASVTLKRPLDVARSTYVRQLLCRNWFQVKHSEAIYAVSRLLPNQNSLVAGGTGWAVQMGIDNKKPVYLYEQEKETWVEFNYKTGLFEVRNDTPILTKNFAGIGTRELTVAGSSAIIAAYMTTLPSYPESEV